MKRKGFMIILASVIAVCMLAMMGFKSFVNSIRNQRTCKWANIDNIELHAHLDVPKITKWDCDYDKKRNIKRAFFTIDTSNLDLDRYIQINDLHKLSSSGEFGAGNFLNLNDESLDGSEFYYRKSSPGSERYNVLLDKTTGGLWVTIEYID